MGRMKSQKSMFLLFCAMMSARTRVGPTIWTNYTNWKLKKQSRVNRRQPSRQFLEPGLPNTTPVKFWTWTRKNRVVSQEEAGTLKKCDLSA